MIMTMMMMMMMMTMMMAAHRFVLNSFELTVKYGIISVNRVLLSYCCSSKCLPAHSTANCHYSRVISDILIATATNGLQVIAIVLC